MSKSRILATMVVLIASTSFCKANNPCPSQTEVKEHEVKTLANNGQVKIGGEVYKIVGEDKITNNYNKKLVNTKQDLEKFLSEAKHGKDPTGGNTLRATSVQTPPGYCAYNISLGGTSKVIAISAHPDQLKGKPARPSTPAPTTPPSHNQATR